MIKKFLENKYVKYFKNMALIIYNVNIFMINIKYLAPGIT